MNNWFPPYHYPSIYYPYFYTALALNPNSNPIATQPPPPAHLDSLVPPPQQLPAQNEVKQQGPPKRSKSRRNQPSGQFRTKVRRQGKGRIRKWDTVQKRAEASQICRAFRKAASLVVQTITFVCRSSKSRSVCDRVFRFLSAELHEGWSVGRFYIYIQQRRSEFSRHQNVETLTRFLEGNAALNQMFSPPEQAFYLRVARILAKVFLEQIPLVILNSKKIGAQGREEHLKSGRKVLTEFLEAMSRPRRENDV